MKSMLARFIKDQSGLETIEYAVLAGICVVVTVVGYHAVAQAVSNKMVDTANQVEGLPG